MQYNQNDQDELLYDQSVYQKDYNTFKVLNLISVNIMYKSMDLINFKLELD